MSNGLEEAKQAITEVCEALKTSPAIGRAIDDLRVFLHGKQDKYDNSVFEPCRLFTRASIETLIRVRLDDKVTRILRGELGDEDSFDDFAGYLVLLRALPIFLDKMEARSVPGPIVTESLKNRGLRVGMTYEEVQNNFWTQCMADCEGPVECTESDPCSACKFLDGALCGCGHSFMLHGLKTPSNVTFCPADESCKAFSLASWPNESLDDVAADEAVHVNANVDGWTAVPSASKRLADAINSTLHGAAATPLEDGSEYGAATITATEPKKEPTMTDTKKPRIDRKTWHETEHGLAVVSDMRSIFERNPCRPMFARDVAAQFRPTMPLVESDIRLALDYLLSTATIVQHGKAKGTRYAVAGFTDWPATLPRGKKSADATPPVTASDIAPYTRDGMNEAEAADSET